MNDLRHRDGGASSTPFLLTHIIASSVGVVVRCRRVRGRCLPMQENDLRLPNVS
ncbi:hypothetical protein BD311DRAFT_764975 [Dichomitus squalens]|uniref:Uncharacterized protein n=1 Tax=Dichomitus squalens TaxID=114155 RepID=A0A4Q9MHA4_9APHY|nr:hypothetical protein BD311DRAFT_764975 [Dichomitus squalens]